VIKWSPNKDSIFYAYEKLTLLCGLLPSVSMAFCFDEAGAYYNVPPDLFRSISQVEISLNPNAYNENRDQYGKLNLPVIIGIVLVRILWASLSAPKTPEKYIPQKFKTCIFRNTLNKQVCTIMVQMVLSATLPISSCSPLELPDSSANG
jgi:hypothetical protein